MTASSSDRWGPSPAIMIRARGTALMILAVAYYEAGQTEQAVHATERAIRQAEKDGDRPQAVMLRHRLQLYRNQLSGSRPDR